MSLKLLLISDVLLSVEYLINEFGVIVKKREALLRFIKYALDVLIDLMSDQKI